VVESSLGIPTGMFGKAVMPELWGGVGTTVMVGTHMAQEGASGWV
jgi:hypothetical protein